jgi:DNA-directed RNA polymerase subunit M/transcription elongation factor TFIIS
MQSMNNNIFDAIEHVNIYTASIRRVALLVNKGSPVFQHKIIRAIVADLKSTEEFYENEMSQMMKSNMEAIGNNMIDAMENNMMDTTSDDGIVDGMSNSIVDGMSNYLTGSREEDEPLFINHMMKNLKHIAMMTPITISPETFKKEVDIINIRTGIKVMHRTSLFKTCPRCKNKTVKFREIYVRAADEAANERHECTTCDHIW